MGHENDLLRYGRISDEKNVIPHVQIGKRAFALNNENLDCNIWYFSLDIIIDDVVVVAFFAVYYIILCQIKQYFMLYIIDFFI